MRIFLIATVLLAACAQTTSVADAEAELRQATEYYARLVKAMDSNAIANLYTADGESIIAGQAPIHGREAIRKQLESFSGYSVQSERLTADAITLDGPRAHVNGTYRQRVRVPAGDVIEVHGAYAADWLSEGNHWHLQKLLTTPQ
ncbi:MAG: nuclear transport factor 2 family protein [Thermoanaerobaculia bacterium]